VGLESSKARSGDQVRRIHVENGLSLRFPGRDEDFNEGVEIGILATLMSSGQRGFTHWVSSANVEQAREMASQMGYRLTAGAIDGDLTEVILRTGRARPTLTLVHSRRDAGQNVA
jgi:hypothetical protein